MEVIKLYYYFQSVQSFSHVQLFATPWTCSTPGFPVHHQLLELAQTHVHSVGDTIKPSHPLSSISPPAFNLSQHQGLFQWVSSLHQVAIRSFSFSISPSNEYSVLIILLDWSPRCSSDSQESSPTPQFKSINSLALSFLYSPTLTSTHYFGPSLTPCE